MIIDAQQHFWQLERFDYPWMSPKDDWLVQAPVLRGLRRLAEIGLTYDLLVHTRHLRHVPVVAESCPDLRLVSDHCARPPLAKHRFDEWSRAIAPALNDSAIRKFIGELPSTPLEIGMRETMSRFAGLRDAGRLDTSDIDA